MWSQHDYHAHVEPHDFIRSVVEYKTDTGMRYIMDYCDFAPNATDEHGRLIKNSSLWDGFDGHAPSGILGFLKKHFGIEANDD